MRTARRAILIVTVAAVAAVASLATWDWRVWQLPTQRAYRACAECADLSPSDVDSLIDIMRDSRSNRGQCLELYRQHSIGPAAECEPCALAVVDAAGK